MHFANSHVQRHLRAALRTLVTLVAGASVGHALALNDLSNAPLFTGGTTAVKPNIMFIMDDSGSMQWDFMPDAATVLHRGMYGRWSAQCNGLAYDPSVTYGVPATMNASNTLESKGNADVAAYTTANPATQTTDIKTVHSVSNASPNAGNSMTVTLTGTGLYFWSDSGANADTITIYRDASNYAVGQLTASSTSNGRQTLTLTVRYRVGTLTASGVTSYVGKGEPASGEYYKYNGTATKLGYYKADGTIDTGGDFYKECTTLTSTTSSKFTKVTISAATAEQKQNYANWAKYYRNRMMTMQSSASLAFKELDNRYRIGYSTIGQPKAKTGEDDFLHVEDFSNTHKKAFYDKLYASEPGSYGTPLRGALAKAGQYYANKALSQDKDPVQYYCQRNFSILSTDGYWNEGGNRAEEKTSNSYGPYRLDKSTSVGNQDNDLARPMADGNTLKVVTTETWDVLKEARIKQTIPLSTVTTRITGTTATGVTKSEQRTEIARSARCNSGGSARYYRITITQQRDTTTTETRKTTEETTATATATVNVTRNTGVAYTRVITVNNGVTSSDVTGTTTFSQPDIKDSETVAPGGITSRILAPNPAVSTSSSVGAIYEVRRVQGTTCESVSTSTSGWTTTAQNLPLPAATPLTAEEKVEFRTGTIVEAVQGTPTTSTTDKVITAEYTSTGGASNTLADVAAYYYRTDLRTTALSNCTGALGKDVCANEVPGQALTDAYRSFGDAERQQHMTTFTLGMGVSGSLKYDPNYTTLRTGDFHDIVNRGKNWPNVSSGQNTTVDDLWHAAVNGRGQYFSAGDPNSLVNGLSSALTAIQSVTGSASAASTSSLQPVTGDNDIYVAQFTTMEWWGDVLAYQINPDTGVITTRPTWSAKEQLDNKDHTTRKIYYKKPGATETALREFTYTNLDADGLGGSFTNFCAKTGAAGGVAPSQCTGMSDADKLLANEGANLVGFLRGDQGKSYFRTRKARLGDIINASPLFIGKPGFRYTENDYGKYASDNATRQAVVLAAANDGMLHAFARGTGEELWAYIPSFALPNLYKLADTGFETHHSYFVDGSPQIGDIFVDGAWKTIVVGGLNKGGRGYYALDVTTPESPKLLWEFRHDDLGYSYGNPIITKRKNGDWVVVFASGYDNVAPGDGNGHLFVLNAKTGTLAAKISTETSNGVGAGTSTSPSGLARINSWVDSELINTSQRFYGGDEKGNLWRFDIDGLVEPHGKALRLAEFKGPTGAAQPITAKPALAEVAYNGINYPVVYVATGTYFRNDDAKDKSVQSIYAVKDPLTGTGHGNVRTNTAFQAQTITGGTVANRPTRTTSSNAVNWVSKSGWRADFPEGGERVTVNPQMALDTLYVGSNLPRDDDCTVGGESFLYQFDIATGSATASYVGGVLVQGLTVVQLVSGAAAGSIVTIITRSDGSLQTEIGMPPSAGGSLRRTSWRELID